MSFRSALAIVAGKATRTAIRLAGRKGSSTPGVIGLKICPDLPAHFKMPDKTIVVTGSNGKTTTTELIYHAAKEAGIDMVCNTEGSNQTEGVSTMLMNNCSVNGKVHAAAALIESDERYCQYTFRDMKPKYFVITNLYRDQLTRNGNSEFVRKEVIKGLNDDATLIINADDPNIYMLAKGHKSYSFGVSKEVMCEPEGAEHAYYDGCYCPVCGSHMKYEYHTASHIGKYECTGCDYKRGEVDHEVTGKTENSIIIDGKYEIVPQMMNMMFIYNSVAAFTTLVEVLGIKPEDAATYLSNYRITNDRVQYFSIKGHKGIFSLTKHENSMAYNGAIETACNDPADKTIVVIVDRLSRKHVANDMSWLWDIDFEKLADPSFKRVILSGGFAHELAVRMAVAGVDEEKITVEPDFDKMMDSLYGDPIGDIYCCTCFTDVDKFIGRLREDEK